LRHQAKDSAARKNTRRQLPSGVTRLEWLGANTYRASGKPAALNGIMSERTAKTQLVQIISMLFRLQVGSIVQQLTTPGLPIQWLGCAWLASFEYFPTTKDVFIIPLQRPSVNTILSPRIWALPTFAAQPLGRSPTGV